MKHLAEFLKNRIWFAAAAVLFVLLAVQGCGRLYEPAMALEQSVRCGMEEHIHNEDCYMDELLVCEERSHTHSENCYILLAEDNDFNAILTDMSEKGIHTLEDYMAYVLKAVYGEGAEIDALLRYTSIEELNALLSTTGDKALRFNAGLDLPATYAVGDTPQTSGNFANFYIYLDEKEFVYIGNTTITERAYYGYYGYVTKSDIAAIFNTDEIVSNVTANNIETGSSSADGIQVRYRTSVPSPDISSTYFNNNGDRHGSSGDDSQRINTGFYSPIYATLMFGQSYYYTPINFYTVTLDYSNADAGKADQVQYVQEGQNSTFTPDMVTYTWHTSPDEGAPALNATEINTALSNISSKTTLYAKPNSHTVTFNSNGGSEVASQTVAHRDKVKVPAEPSRANCTFRGWYTDATCTTPYDFDTEVTGSFTLYAKWTATITWLHEDGTVLETDPDVLCGTMPTYNGAEPAKASATPGKSWVFAGWTPTPALVTGNAEYTAKFAEKTATYTVSFVTNGGSEIAPRSVEHGKTLTDIPTPTRPGHSFLGWYLGEEAFDFTTPITGNITLTAKWEINKYTVSFVDGSTGSTVETKTDIPYGSVITLPEVAGGIYWQLDSGEIYSAGDEFTVSGNATFTSIDKVSATYIYKDGTTTHSTPVDPGTVITLPAVKNAGHVWLVQGGDGTPYSAGATYTLSENTTFVESSTLNVKYNVAFPAGSRWDGSITIYSATSPTLNGTNVTSLTDNVAEGSGTSARNLTSREVIATTNQGAQFKYAYYFLGWLTADGTLIAPGSNLTWDVLAAHADASGNVALTGSWQHGIRYTANFCVRYNSITGTGVFDADKYTPSIFTTALLGDIDTSFVVTESSDDAVSYANDQKIRSLYGDSGSGMHFNAFPSDEYIFEQLKLHATSGQLTVGEGENMEIVNVNELNSSYYAIRWYAFKYDSGDGWHVDGKLVKKTGQITVDKIFGGISDAVNKAMTGFYVLAENGYLDAGGNFVAYTSADYAYNAHVLVLNAETEAALKGTYPDAVFQIRDFEDSVADGLKEEWLISDVRLGEYWRFTEHAAHPSYTDPSGTEKKYSWYAEYTITDTDGEHSAIAEFGSTAKVLGKTYALDEDPDQGLSIKFTNYYYSNDSVLVRKIDSDTGEPLGGASFELWQPTTKGGDSVKLRFSDDGNGVYTLDENGDKDTITTNDQGFSVITITGFSFDAGPLTVKEVVPPDGYDLVNPVTVHYLNGTDGAVGITGISNIDPSRFSEFAEYNVDENTEGGVIVVKDHTSYEATVTARKIWENPDFTADSVTVVLQATVNGVTQNAGALFPNLVGHQVVLNAANNWTHTWTGLSAYANGELVQWSIKEIKVGSDPTLSDGVSFASWIASYSPVSSWDSNGDGVTDSWYTTVTNAQKRPMVNIYKVDGQTNAVLEGATFTLEKVQWNGSQWEQIPGSLTLSHTSDENGWLLFDNLTPSSAGSSTFYRLTETSPPMGYTKLADSVVFTIDGFGNIYEAVDGAAGTTALDTEYVDFYSRYYITVRNEAMPAFPETGGNGTDVYIRLGGLLMLAAAAAAIYKAKRRREGDASAV